MGPRALNLADSLQPVSTWVATAVVIGGAVSVYVRTQTGPGPTKIDVPDLAVLLFLAIVALLLVFLTRNWRIGFWVALFSALGWVILLGPAGDTSCTDCAFVLLIPLGSLGLQAALASLALFVPQLRD